MSYSNSEDNEDGVNQKKAQEETYYSSDVGLKNNLHGEIYQLKLLMWFIKIGVQNGYQFRLATEMDAAEKFDDLVFDCKGGEDRRYRFLQAKHKQDETKRITRTNLLSEDGDFSLQKYFISFRNIKKNREFQDKNLLWDFILCTNIGFHKTLEGILKEITMEDEFFPKVDGAHRYQLNINELHELYDIFKKTSDVYMLANELIKHIIDPKKPLTLTPNIFKYYHIALVQEKVIIRDTKDKNIGKFSKEFINLNDPGLSESARKLQEVLQLHLDECNTWEVLQRHLNKIKGLSVIDKNTELKYLYSVWQAIEILIEKEETQAIKDCFGKFNKNYINYNLKLKNDPNNDPGLSATKLWDILKEHLDKIKGLSLKGTKETKDCIRKLTKQFIINYNFNNTGLSKSAMEFQTDLQQDQVEIKALSVNKDIELKLSSTFGEKFDLHRNPQLTDIDTFTQEFVTHVEITLDKKVTIGRSKAKGVADNFAKLAGHVLIIKDKKIQFSKAFFDDSIKLPGNLNDFKNKFFALQTQSLDDLKLYEFKIGGGFKTCEENLLSAKTYLPNDKIEDEEITDFFKKLVFAVNQPNEKDLGDIINFEMGKEFNLLNADLVTDSFLRTMLDWFKEKRNEKGKEGTWLSKNTAKDFFKKIGKQVNSLEIVGLSLLYSAELKGYGIEFKGECYRALKEFLTTNDSTQIFKLNDSTETIFNAIKVYRTLRLEDQYKKDDSYIFLRLQTIVVPDIQQKVIEAFNSQHSHHLLVIDCDPEVTEQDAQNLHTELSNIITMNSVKKIILIAKENDALAMKFETDPKDNGGNDKNGLDDLTPDSQDKLLKKELVVLQGKKTSINKLINQNDKHAKENIDSETLIKLIKNQEIQIGCQLKEINEYYIPRRFNRQVTFNKVKIKEDIFKSNLESDIFVISGTDSGLERAINKIYVFNKYDYELADKEFRELSEQKTPSNNIHWLISESGYLILNKSKGSIANLVKYRNTDKVDITDDKTPKIGLEEETYLKKNESKIVIIADTAGMGKSTVLSSLSIKMKEDNPSLWVIRIDLNDYATILATELKNRKLNKPTFSKWDVDKVVNFLLDLLKSQQQSKLKTNLEEKLFISGVNGKVKIAFIFDGFDEISPDYQNVVIDILQALKQSKVEKVFVTTRPNTRELLEETLEVFSDTLEPFDNQDQIKFLTKFWTKKLKEEGRKDLNQEELKSYAKSLIEQFSISINDKEREFVGIPLQTMMLAEIFQEDLNADHTHTNNPKLPEKFDLLSLYEKFVKKKIYEFLWQGKRGRNLDIPGEQESADVEYENLKKRYEKLALSALFSDEVLETFLLPKEIEELNFWIKDIKNFKKNEGIVDKIIDNKPHFIQRTFAEYFASFPVVEKMPLNPTKICPAVNSLLTSPVFIRSIAELLNKQTVRKESHTVLEFITINRNNNKDYLEFFNALLEMDYQDDLGKTSLHYGVQYNCKDTIEYVLNYKHDVFGNDILKHGNFINKEYENSNLVKFVNTKDKDGNTALDFADNSKLDMMLSFKLLLNGARIDRLTPEYLKELTLYMLHTKTSHHIHKHNLYFNCNILQPGVNFKHQFRPIQEKLLMACPKIFPDLNKEEDQSRLLSYFFLNGRIEVIKTLLSEINDEEKKRRLLNAKCDTPLDLVNGEFSQLSDNDRLEISKYIIENCDTDDKDIDNILQYAACNGHINTFMHFIDQGNHNEYNILYYLYKACTHEHFNIVEYLFDEYSTNIKHDGNTALHALIDSEASLNIIIKYFEYSCIKKSEEINAKNDRGKTPLLNAIHANRRLKIIKYLVDHGDVNIADNEGNTALYYAIKNDQRDTINYLLECKAEINLPSELMRNKLEFFKNPNGFNLNLAAENGMPRLHLAIQSGDLEWAKFIIQQGANINIKDRQERTPLHWACQTQQTEFIELLLQCGAIFDAQDIYYSTPLDLSQEVNSIQLLDELNDLFISQNLIQDLSDYCQYWEPSYDNLRLIIVNARNAEGSTLFHKSADTNDKEVIEILLQFNHDYLQERAHNNKKSQSTPIDAIDSQENTPLHLAAQKGYNEIVSLLLEKGAIFNAENRQGKTPEALAKNNHHDNITELLQPTTDLFIAIEQNSLVKVKNSINAGAYINAKGKNGQTPLHCAASSDQSAIVQFLLTKKANIEALDTHNRTPLHFATQNNKIEIVKLLLKNGAGFDAKDIQDKAPFEFEENPSVNLLDAINKLFNDLQSYNPKVSITNLEMVHSNYEIDISTIINIRDSQGNTILHYAAESNDINIVRLLLENGAIFDAENKLDKNAQAFTSHQDIIRSLQSIENMFNDVNNIYQEKETVNVQIIINARNDRGRTLLHVAAEYGELYIVQWLVENGADVKAIDQHGKTVLHAAVKSNKLKIVEYLVEKGTDINAKDILGKTPLHKAASSCNLDLVKFLLEMQGSDVNAIDEDGNTVLHIAAKWDNNNDNNLIEVVEYLVKPKTDDGAGADITIKNFERDTALDIAKKRRFQPLVMLLTQAYIPEPIIADEMLLQSENQGSEL